MAINNYMTLAIGVFIGINIGTFIMGVLLLLRRADVAIDEVLSP